MYTEKELLKLSGKLALVCNQVLQSNVFTLSDNVKQMEIVLLEYDNAIMENMKNDE